MLPAMQFKKPGITSHESPGVLHELREISAWVKIRTGMDNPSDE